MNSPFIFFLNTHGVWLFVAFIFFYEYLVAKKAESAWHGLFSVATALIISIVLKELFLIQRPFEANSSLPSAGLAYFSSLPSAHAAVAFALATSTALHNRQFGIFLFAVSSMISIGRVAASVHYPLDIAFGVLIGVLTGLFFDTIHFRKTRGKIKH